MFRFCQTLAGAAAALLAACGNLAPADRPAHTFQNAHTFGATAIAFSPDGARMASGGYRGDLRLWQVSPPKLLHSFPPHDDSVRAIAFVSDAHLISAGDDGNLVVWDVDNRRPLARQATLPVAAIASDERQAFTGHRDGVLRAWRFPSLQPVGEASVGAPIIAVALHGNLLAVATDSGRVALFGPEPQWLRDLQTKGPVAHDLRFSPDGRQIFAGAWFRLLVWNVADGELQSIVTDHTGLLNSVDVSPDGRQLVSLGRHTDSAIRIWDREHLTVERRYQAHELCGAMIRFSPDGRHMASASDDESIRLYDLRGQASSRGALSP